MRGVWKRRRLRKRFLWVNDEPEPFTPEWAWWGMEREHLYSPFFFTRPREAQMLMKGIHE
jgi:hypothetical protein